MLSSSEAAFRICQHLLGLFFCFLHHLPDGFPVAGGLQREPEEWAGGQKWVTPRGVGT